MASVPLGFVVCTQRVVARPGVTVTVVDAAGSPVADAVVVLDGWSQPHSRFERRDVVRTDAAGRVQTTELARREMIWPMCQHGIPRYHHTICAGADGHGSATVRFEGEDAMTIRLPGGAYDGECEPVRRKR